MFNFAHITDELHCLHHCSALSSFNKSTYGTLLNMTVKYQTWPMFTQLIRHELPDTYNGLQHLLEDHSFIEPTNCTQESPPSASPWTPRSLLDMIEAARRTSMSILLPPLLLLCSTIDTSTFLSAAKAQNLDEGLQTEILDGRRRLGAHAQHHIRQCLVRCRFDKPYCPTHQRSSVGGPTDDVDAIRILFFPFSAPVPVTAGSDAPCRMCVADYWDTVARSKSTRKESWEQLPLFWKLDSWEKLRADFSSLVDANR